MADNNTGQKVWDFDVETSPHWIETVTSWKWRKIGEDQYKISGDCPRCGDYMYEIVGYQIEGYVYEREKLRQTVWVQCNCSAKHPGAPEGSNQGCGQGAEIPFAGNIRES